MRQSFSSRLRSLTLLAMTAFALTCVAGKWVKVTYEGGQDLYISLTDEPIVRIHGDEVEIGAGSPVTISLMDSPEFRITDENTVEEIKAPGIPVLMRSGDLLSIRNMKPAGMLRLFDLTGSLLASCTSDPAGEATIDLTSLPDGIYLVATDSLTFKIIK